MVWKGIGIAVLASLLAPVILFVAKLIVMLVTL